MRKLILWIIVTSLTVLFPIGCRSDYNFSLYPDYPMIQSMVDDALDEVLVALYDIPQTTKSSTDQRIVALESFLHRSKNGTFILARSSSGDFFTDLSYEEDSLISSLFDDYPDFTSRVEQIITDLDRDLTGLPSIQVSVRDYDSQGNQIGTPYTIVSDGGILFLGVDTVPVAEYVFRAQAVDSQGSRGVAGEKGGGVFYWPHGIVPYFFDNSISQDDCLWLEARINEIAAGTGLTFEKHKNTTWLRLKYYSGERYVRISQDELGRTPAQVNGLGVKWLSTLTVDHDLLLNKHRRYSELAISHEMGHILGLFHEHQRADRDAYVEVLAPSWISASDRRNNYDIIPYTKSSSWGQLFQAVDIPVSFAYTPFDYNSAMIYGPRDEETLNPFGVFRIDGSPDIEGLENKKNWGDVNGNTYYTPWDIYTIKKIYGIPVKEPEYTP